MKRLQTLANLQPSCPSIQSLRYQPVLSRMPSSARRSSLSITLATVIRSFASLLSPQGLCGTF
jgi:hypothetical protein